MFEVTIDLRDPPEPAPSVQLDQRKLHAELLARRRAEAARVEARRELEELRRRHWSADRIFEESRLGIDWWEHPDADPHALLGILPGDTFTDAQRSRRAIAREIHPDVSAGEESLRQMAAVNGAFDRIRRALGPDGGSTSEAKGTKRPNRDGIALGEIASG